MSAGAPQTAERIEQIFHEVLNVDVPDRGADLIEAGLLDSLALVELLFELEQEFGIRVDVETLDIDALSTVDGIAAYVVAATEAVSR